MTNEPTGSAQRRFEAVDVLWALFWTWNAIQLLDVASHAVGGLAIFGGPGKPVSDFGVYWTVARSVWDGAPAAPYDQPTLDALLSAGIGPPPRILFWLYPPPALLLVAPFGLLPYEVGYLVFAGFSVAAWCAVAWRLFPHPLSVALALLHFPVVFNLHFGQNGLILAAGIGVVLLAGMSGSQRPDRETLAGVVLGVLAIKPHLAALLVIWLILARRWRILAVGAATGALFGLASLVAFGMQPWQGFLEHVGGTSARLLDRAILSDDLVPSVYIGLCTLGVPSAAASAGQVLSGFLALGAIAWTRFRPYPEAIRAAALCLVVPLASPYVMHYDLAITGIAAILVARHVHERGGRVLPWVTALSVGHATFGLTLARESSLQVTALIGWVSVAVLLAAFRGGEVGAAAVNPPARSARG